MSRPAIVGQRPRRRPPEPPFWEPVPEPAGTQTVHWIAFATVLLLAIVVRLKEPLSSSIIGAEDPYLFMERTWNLLQGWEIWDYPVPGFMFFLAPFAMLGPDAFYWAARFLPVLFGAAGTAGTFFLIRPGAGPWPALTGATCVALMPEHIRRTNLLFPTALDLALLPFLLLLALRIARGRLYAMIALPAALVVMLFVHPWFVALFVPPVATFLLVEYARRPGKHALQASVAGASSVAFVVIVMVINPIWDPFKMLSRRAMPRVASLVANPASIMPLPWRVDPVSMLTIPAIFLAILGIFVAFTRRTPLGTLGLAWTLMLLPITLVDWFGVRYIPHRTVAYMATGVAILAALAVREGLRRMEGRPPKAQHLAAAGAVALVAILMIPSAVATPTWYRLYDEDDYAAYEALNAMGRPHVEAGSWETRAGYRAMTGGPAEFYPQFFWDAKFREQRVKDYPDIVVIISDRTERENLPTGFLHDWELIGSWGDVQAYRPPSNSTA